MPGVTVKKAEIQHLTAGLFPNEVNRRHHLYLHAESIRMTVKMFTRKRRYKEACKTLVNSSGSFNSG